MTTCLCLGLVCKQTAGYFTLLYLKISLFDYFGCSGALLLGGLSLVVVCEGRSLAVVSEGGSLVEVSGGGSLAAGQGLLPGVTFLVASPGV